MIKRKSKQSIREEIIYSKLNLFRLGFVLFILISSVILISRGIFEIDVRLGQGVVFTLVIMTIMLLYLLFTKKNYKIQYFDSNLIINQGILRRTQEFEILNIVEIDFLIEKSPIWDFIKSKKFWSIKGSLIVNIIDSNYLEKIFIFKYIKNQLDTNKWLENKEEALNLEFEFEDKLRELKNSFPNQVKISVEKKDHPERKLKWISTIKLCLVIPFFASILYISYSINFEGLISAIFWTCVFISAGIGIDLYHKLNKKRIYNFTDFNNLELYNSNGTYMNFRRFIINNPSYYKKRRNKELKINVPDICPICGCNITSDTLKIKDIYSPTANYVKISVCKEHKNLELEERSPWIERIFMSIMVLFFILFLFAIFFKNFELAIVFICISLGTFFIGVVIMIIKTISVNRFISKYIFFEFFDEGVVISVKIPEWAELFKKSNDVYEMNNHFMNELSRLDFLRIKLRKELKLFIFLMIISILTFTPVHFLSLYLINYPILMTILITIVIISIILYFFFAIILIDIHIILDDEMRNKRYEIYFKKTSSRL